jgi:RNA polymerase sigma-70 factor (ECF subfamily)
MDLQSPSPAASALGTALPENVWVRPIPDGRVIDHDGDPADVAVSRDTIRLAFVAALQFLPPRQRAALILRDVLRWQATEVADLLDTSVVSVNGLVRRARATLASHDLTTPGPREPTQRDEELLARYVEAFERLDVDALVSLLREDAVLSMPPYALWLSGRSAVGNWLTSNACKDARLVPVEANGEAGFAVYKRTSPGDDFEAYAIQVLEMSVSHIAAIHTFLDPSLFALFDLPPALAESPG